MIARLQRFITLSLLAAAAVWAAVLLQAGHPGWAAVAVATVLGGHAVVLGLEFLLLREANRDDPAPPARAAQLAMAWIAEVAIAPRVFCWRQPFRSARWPDRVGPEAAGQRGVVFVHGFICNRGVWNPWLERLTQRDIPFAAVSLEPVFGSIDAYVPILEDAVQRVERATGLAPVIVAHSMGGLALRRWWAEFGDDARIHRAITLGTPHHGTWLARFAFSRNGRQMRLASGWQRTLAAREPVQRSTRFTCFYSHCDNIVFPASTATLAGADNRHLPAVAHVQMVDRPEPFDEMLRWLNR